MRRQNGGVFIFSLVAILILSLLLQVSSVISSVLIRWKPNTLNIKAPVVRCPVDHCLALGEKADEQYPNLIVVTNQRTAGLLDRLIFITHIMNIASMLCARVFVAPPGELLTAYHNNNNKVPEELDWEDDFVSFPFITEQQGERSISSRHKTFPRKVTTPLLSGDSLKRRSPVLYQAYLNYSGASAKGKTVLNTGNLSSIVHWFLNDKNYNVVRFADLFRMVEKHKKRLRDHLENMTISHRSTFVWEIKCKFVYKCLAEARHSLQNDLLELALKDDDPHLNILPYLPNFFNNKTDAVQKSFYRLKGFTTCGSYVQGMYPPLILNIAKVVLQKATFLSRDYTHGRYFARNPTYFAGPQNTPSNGKDSLYQLQFAFLHLRRGDSLENCDTSVERIHKYLACSLGGPKARKYMKMQQEHHRKPFVLFLASEEKEQSYRAAIMETIEEVSVDLFNFGEKRSSPSPTTPLLSPILPIDLDLLVQRVVEEEIEAGRLSHAYRNNYSIFWIGRAIGRMASFMLKQRRDLNCDICNKQLAESAFDDLMQQENAFSSTDGITTWHQWIQEHHSRQWENLQVASDLLWHSGH
mmetsp:Transcript_2001/g.4314  ORF Transcript_2001/g.4314 Transcript_2001/m.4314 type:complete len:582 (-) Transcript_2001:105-1850(-)